MTTGRSKTTHADAEQAAPLFRGASPEKSESAAMDIDAEEDAATAKAPVDELRTEVSMTSAVPGDEFNLTPRIDDSVMVEESSVDSSLPGAHKGPPSNASSAQQDSNLIASLPVYFSKSLPSSSSLQLFQYPTYPRGQPLPIPESARARGLRQAIRYRPKAKRVEVELPLDMRPAVYNMDKGEEMGKGADAGGSIGQGPSSSPRVKIKKEYGVEERSNQRSHAKRLEKTRLDSTLIPHQTEYMVGIIRDNALHLTPLSTIVQLRPSMHYLDALDAMAQQEKRRAQAGPDEDTDEGSIAEDGGRAAKERKKVQSLSVSVRDSSGASTAPRGKGGIMDSRDLLMLAEREAEAEQWKDLEWKDETTDESRKTFDAQLFASSKTQLECQTRPSEYLDFV